MNEKNGSSTAPVANMWWAHRVRGDRDRGGDHALVPEKGLATEDRDNLGDDPEERQRDDVDLGMAEEPEQVLPQQWPGHGRVVDVRAELAVGEQGKQRRGQHRERHDHHQSGDQHVPGEDRHPEHRHAGRPQRQDGRDDVDSAENRAQPGQHQADDPQVRPDARRLVGAAQIRVAGPAEVRRPVRGEEAAEHYHAAEREQPVREVVEPGKRDVRRTDLQRHDVVGERERQRRREQQHHDRAVHGEELVVLLCR
jgi:hypothetical protein